MTVGGKVVPMKKDDAQINRSPRKSVLKVVEHTKCEKAIFHLLWGAIMMRGKQIGGPV